MIVFFGIVFVIGLLIAFIDVLGKMSDPIPSQYRMDMAQNGIVIMVIGVVGAFCVYTFG